MALHPTLAACREFSLSDMLACTLLCSVLWQLEFLNVHGKRDHHASLLLVSLYWWLNYNGTAHNQVLFFREIRNLKILTYVDPEAFQNLPNLKYLQVFSTTCSVLITITCFVSNDNQNRCTLNSWLHYYYFFFHKLHCLSYSQQLQFWVESVTCVNWIKMVENYRCFQCMLAWNCSKWFKKVFSFLLQAKICFSIEAATVVPEIQMAVNY